MKIFPAQYSTLSAIALRYFLTGQYGLGEISCRLLIRNVSDTYILEGGSNKYIFKVYRDAHRKLHEIQAEVELLNILFEGGAAVSYPIKDAEGICIQEFNAAEGTRYGVMFSYAKGEVVYNLSDEQLITVGREMAVVHNITAGLELSHFRKGYTIDTTITRPLKIVEPAFKNLGHEYAYLNETALRIIEKLKSFDLSAFSYGYCHYDFLPKNFHFYTDNHLTFFDFDFAGKGHLANDIVSFYIHYFLEATYNKITRAEAGRCFGVFVESYRKVRPLSDAEIKAIGCLGFAFWVFYLGFQYENFDDWSNSFFGDKFLKERVGLIKKWVDWFDDFS